MVAIVAKAINDVKAQTATAILYNFRLSLSDLFSGDYFRLGRVPHSSLR